MATPDHPRTSPEPPSPRGRVEGQRRDDAPEDARGRPACPACGGPLVEIKAKLVCSRCRTICETCCEGGPG